MAAFLLYCMVSINCSFLFCGACVCFAAKEKYGLLACRLENDLSFVFLVVVDGAAQFYGITERATAD